MTWWRTDKEFADAYNRHVMQLLGATLGPCLFEIADDAKDQTEATDLLLLRPCSGRRFDIAVRIRRPKYLLHYGDQITIRTVRSSGAKTEMQKILAGFADYMFYGFGDGRGRVAAFTVLDLSVFREWIAFCRRTSLAQDEAAARREIGAELIDNRDGTFGLGFEVARLPGVLCYSKDPSRIL